MSNAEDRAISQLIEQKGLSPENQKIAYARTTALKKLLLEKGILTEEDEARFKELSTAMLADINRKIEKSIRNSKKKKSQRFK